MKRAIIQDLINWKDYDYRKPLIIRGARQVGKSWVVNELGKQYFKGKIHTVNLEQRRDWHVIFDQNFDISRIISELEVVLGDSIENGKDLLFFDEIQECPNAIKCLRYFYEDMPELHVIAAGSLLEFALSDISFPVGRVQMMNMYPMSFYEFLIAQGQERLAAIISSEPYGVSDLINQTIREQLKTYFFIGGMPECVKRYAMNNNLKEIQELQYDIIETYRQDFSKYRPQVNNDCLNNVLTSISKNVGQQIKYTKLAMGFTGPTNKRAFDLLRTAKLIHKVSSASPSALPLGAQINSKQFKAIFLDIGLLVRLSGLSIANEYHSEKLLNIFKGALAEQFVGQELLAHGMEHLYYWARNAKSSNAEVDYLITQGDQIKPIEVKNSAAGRLKSLHLLLKTFSNVREGLVLSDSKFGRLEDQKLTFMPFYFAGGLVENRNDILK